MKEQLSPRHISFLLYLYSHIKDGRIDSDTAVKIEGKYIGGDLEGLIPDLVCPHNLIEIDDDWCVFTPDGISLVISIMEIVNV